MKRFYVLIISSVFSCITVFAQESDPDSTGNKRIELPAAMISVGKSEKEYRKDEDGNVRIGAAAIKKRVVMQDIPYLLNGISSVVVNSDAGQGTGYTGIRIRGADLTRINVTMNGVPVNDAESQATYFVNTPDILSSANDVQISKGVGSSKNGVGNFGAGIAINNLDVNKQEAFCSIETGAGSFNTYKVLAKLGTGLINKKFNATLRLSQITSDGYIQRSASNLRGMQFTAKYLVNPSTQVVFNYMDGKEKTGQAWNGVSGDSLKTNRTFNELGRKNDGSFYDNQTDNYRQQYHQLFIDHKINKNFVMGSTLFYTKGRGYYEEYKTDQSFSNYGLPDLILGQDTIRSTELIRQLWLDNDFLGGRVYLNYFSSKLDAGLYLNYNDYSGKHFGEVIWSPNNIPSQYRWYDLDAFKKDMNVYAMADYRVNGKLSLFVDAQLRNVNYRINGFRNNPGIQHDLNYLFFNPKVKVLFKHRQHVFSLLAGIAQKEPNREDVEASKNEVPKSERLMNVELNHTVRLGNLIQLHHTAFLMVYKDQLALTGKVNDVGAYTRSNVPESYRIGLEVEAAIQTPDEFIRFAPNLALSQNRITRFTEYIDDYDAGGQQENVYRNTDLAFSPSAIAGARLSVLPFSRMNVEALKKLSFDIMYKYVGAQYLDNTANKQRRLDAFHNTDFYMHYPIHLREKVNVRLKFALYNLFNSLYESNGYTFSYRLGGELVTSNYYFPQAGRRYALGVALDF